VQLALLEHRLEQRCLPRAVRPDERNMLAALDCEAGVVQEDALADP